MDELWALTKHSINSDLNTPLNQLMKTLTAEEKTLINNIISKLDNSTYGLSALKSAINSVNSNTGEYLNRTYVPSDSNTLYTGLTSWPSAESEKLVLFGTWTPKYNGIVKVQFSGYSDNRSIYACATQLIGMECNDLSLELLAAISNLTSLGDIISSGSDIVGLSKNGGYIDRNIPVIKGIPLKIFAYTINSTVSGVRVRNCKICGTAVSM